MPRDKLRILTWHVHGNYLYYLSQVPHQFYVLSRTISRKKSRSTQVVVGLCGKEIRMTLGLREEVR